MIKVNKYNNEFGNQIELVFPDKKRLDLIYAGNLDLYIIHNTNTSNNIFNFQITEDDYDLYNIFNTLYTSIIEYKPYGDEIDEVFKYNEKFKQYPLVKNNEINFYSDDDPEEIATLLKITKENDIINLQLKYGTHMEGVISTGVRIRTSGSRYDSFFIPFMQMYNEINKTDFEYHQITIDEYIKKLRR